MSNLASQDRNSFPRCVQSIRMWEDQNLPLSQSRIAFDLFVLIAKSAQDGKPLTIKELFNSLKYSERGIRYVLDEFVAGGWCEIISHARDKRFRLVVGTDLLHLKLQEYEGLVLSVYRSHFYL